MRGGRAEGRKGRREKYVEDFEVEEVSRVPLADGSHLPHASSELTRFGKIVREQV